MSLVCINYFMEVILNIIVLKTVIMPRIIREIILNQHFKGPINKAPIFLMKIIYKTIRIV